MNTRRLWRFLEAFVLLLVAIIAQDDVNGHTNMGRGSCQDARGKQYSYLQKVTTFPNAWNCGRRECERFGMMEGYRGFEFSVTNRCTCLFDSDELPVVPNDQADSPQYISKRDAGDGDITSTSGTPGANCYKFVRLSDIVSSVSPEDCVADGTEAIATCCPDYMMQSGICTFFSCMNLKDETILLNDDCKCNDVRASCFNYERELGMLGIAGMCSQIGECCHLFGSTTSDFNECLGNAQREDKFGPFISDEGTLIVSTAPEVVSIYADPLLESETSLKASILCIAIGQHVEACCESVGDENLACMLLNCIANPSCDCISADIYCRRMAHHLKETMPYIEEYCTQIGECCDENAQMSLDIYDQCMTDASENGRLPFFDAVDESIQPTTVNTNISGSGNDQNIFIANQQTDPPAVMPTYVPTVYFKPCENPYRLCRNGIFNLAKCECDCIPPFCHDSVGDCTILSNDCGDNPWIDCEQGFHCPWWDDPETGGCAAGPDVPAGIWDIYASQSACCRAKYPYSTNACEDNPTQQPTAKPYAVEIIPFQLSVSSFADNLSTREAKDVMVIVIREIMYFRVHLPGLRFLSVEERILPYIRKLEEALQRDLERTVTVYCDVSFANYQYNDVGPLVIKELRDSYEEFVEIVQTHFGQDTNLNLCTPYGESNICLNDSTKPPEDPGTITKSTNIPNKQITTQPSIQVTTLSHTNDKHIASSIFVDSNMSPNSTSTQPIELTYYPDLASGVCVSDKKLLPGASSQFIFSNATSCCEASFPNHVEDCLRAKVPTSPPTPFASDDYGFASNSVGKRFFSIRIFLTTLSWAIVFG